MAAPARRVLGHRPLLVALAGSVVLGAAVHLTQGTSGVAPGDLLALATGGGDAATRDVLLGSRIPRLAAGLTVGACLGVAGTLLQSLHRNAMASPDTLAVTGGAYFAVTLVAAFGLAVPLWGSAALAFAGGLGAAATVMWMAGRAASTTRLVLAGSAIALGLQAATSMLLVVFSEETTSLVAWGSGSLSQLGLDAFEQVLPVLALGLGGSLWLARRLDVLSLGDDVAAVLGVGVRATRLTGTVLAVLLAAAAVTLAGPIGFVGLGAPAVARLLGRAAPGLLHHARLLPASGLLGALVVVSADVAMRALLGAQGAARVPTGITTTVAGSVVLIVLARQGRDAGPTRRPPEARTRVRSRRRFLVVLALVATAAAGTVVVGLLVGHTWVRTGDIVEWLTGGGPPRVRFALDERAPRVAAAVLAGGALALSGALVQATTRNPLAEPGLVGVTAGAGLAAVLVTDGGAATSSLIAVAVLGSCISCAAVYGLSWRNGLDADRLVLVGIGVWYGVSSVTAFLLLRADPWDTPRLYTWLSGTTYGRTWPEVVPVALVLAVSLPAVLTRHRELDLLALDEDTPKLSGVELERTRRRILAVAAALGATSVAAAGVVGFVGLVAPHLARALVGARHLRALPVAVLVGGVLLGAADALGRSVVAPSQLPAGLVVAILGAPYFVWLLGRSRR